MTVHSQTTVDAPARRGSTAGYVLEALRNGIFNGRFAPGQRLIEADLTRELGVSRGTLREGLRRLAAEGLIEVVPNRGAVVRRLSRDEVEELYVIRESLEGLAARLAAERIGRPGNRERFAAVFEHARQQNVADFVARFVDENRRFHQTIVDLSGNAQLARLIQQMQLPLVMFQLRNELSSDDLRQSLVEHEAIGRAILAGDPGAADAAMRAHLHRAAMQILKLPPSAFRA